MAEYWEEKVHASLPLQILLYFNSLYDILFFFLLLICIWYQSYQRPESIAEDRWWKGRVILSSLSVFFEPIRVTLGYVGNLTEKVPLLGAFLGVSVVPILGSCICLLFLPWFHLTGLEFALFLCLFIFVVLEVPLGLLALKNVSQGTKAVKDFYQTYRSP
eukprot:Platyproteum_vivax@DN1286_c0_g1_i2.p1